MRASVPSRVPSPLWLARAPHRLLFFAGASQVFLAMLWWVLWLIAMRWDLWPMPPPLLPAGLMHGVWMQYLVLPGFFFGFLLTVFPRWIGLTDLSLRHYLPVALAILGGQWLVCFGAFGWRPGIPLGVLLVLAGWAKALVTLGRLLYQDKGACWHARVCFAALVIGWLGLCMVLAVVLGTSAHWLLISLKLGSFGLLLPVYITVAHRMFPFFAKMVFTDYHPWRPLPWLGAVLMLLVVHLGLELMTAPGWLWLTDVPLTLLSAWALWRWWPRGRMPGLLAVLFVGSLWLPVAFGILSLQSLALLISDVWILGRAPLHALFIGFFGSILVAMVTRVTQGHAGRPLLMPKVAWYAFVALQAVTVLRMVAEITADSYAWQALAALGWLLALAPWLGRIIWIYLSPRADGKPG